jgi:hypothetical protein
MFVVNEERRRFDSSKRSGIRPSHEGSRGTANFDDDSNKHKKRILSAARTAGSFYKEYSRVRYRKEAADLSPISRSKMLECVHLATLSCKATHSPRTSFHSLPST